MEFQGVTAKTRGPLLENGEIDIMGDISYTDERAEKMLYSDMPMGEEKYIWTACRCASGIEN